jgi:hypothetical protein
MHGPGHDGLGALEKHWPGTPEGLDTLREICVVTSY